MIVLFLLFLLGVVVMATIKNKVVTDKDQRINPQGAGNLSDEISGFIISVWSLKMPVHIAALVALSTFLFENPFVDTQTLNNIDIRTRIVTIKSSFISRICFHMQMYMNFAREMKNNVRKEYQTTTEETHTCKLHISMGSGPNHTLQELIPHTNIPQKAPCEIIKTTSSRFLLAKKSEAKCCKKSCKVKLFACVA